jgi:hypothetical protein
MATLLENEGLVSGQRTSFHQEKSEPATALSLILRCLLPNELKRNPQPQPYGAAAIDTLLRKAAVQHSEQRVEVDIAWDYKCLEHIAVELTDALLSPSL